MLIKPDLEVIVGNLELWVVQAASRNMKEQTVLGYNFQDVFISDLGHNLGFKIHKIRLDIEILNIELRSMSDM